MITMLRLNRNRKEMAGSIGRSSSSSRCSPLTTRSQGAAVGLQCHELEAQAKFKRLARLELCAYTVSAERRVHCIAVRCGAV